LLDLKNESSRKATKNWHDEVEEDWKIMRIRNWHAVTRDGKEWRTVLLTTKINNG
jgi:hypothetical protein